MPNSKSNHSKDYKIDLSKKIGTRLKDLRKSMGLSMKQLADETGLSTALFSRIENGLVIPSIPTLQMIADVLKVDIGYFFEKEEEKGFIISREGERRIVKVRKWAKNKVPYEVELLAEGMENIFMEPVIVTLLGKDIKVEAISHQGQDFSYVIEGILELTLGTNKYVLKKGDSAYYNASMPHKAISVSKKPAKILNVHFIPGKRAGTLETEE